LKSLVWSPIFIRKFKRLIRQNPNLRVSVENTLKKLADDPFQSSLRTHKLKGDLSDRWSCSIDYSNRIVFKFVINKETKEEEIFLLTLGSHDQVY
jgi:mRNA interferase YafQ